MGIRIYMQQNGKLLFSSLQMLNVAYHYTTPTHIVFNLNAHNNIVFKTIKIISQIVI